MAKVSVIVPVYNVEKYLERCIESIRSQTLEDIEIILVDDGSPDNCPKICDEFAEKDSRIKVIHKKNGGLSSARNAGVYVATGEYIGYIDSDDYAEQDMFETLYECARKNQVDFVMADYWRIQADGVRKKKTLDIRGGLYKKQNIIQEIYPVLIMREKVDYGPLLSVCNCLYKTDFIKKNSLFFDEEIKWSEDCIYSAIVGYIATNFYYLKDKYVYNYVQNEGTISTSYKPGAWDVYCKMNEKLREFFEKKTEYNFSRQLDLHMLYFACSVFGQLEYSNYNFRKKYEVCKNVLRDNHLTEAMKNFRLPEVDWKSKTYLFLVKHKLALLLAIIFLRK